jgi:hypothetical protein
MNLFDMAIENGKGFMSPNLDKKKKGEEEEEEEE